MRTWATLEDALAKGRRRVIRNPKFEGHSDVLFESARNGVSPGPQAILVHQEPNWTLPAHFHLQDQFQLIVCGGGKLGPHDLLPFTVHFASEESGYGPIVSGAEGLDYFTLRAVTDVGVHYLPEERQRLRRDLRKRQCMGHVPPHGSGGTHEVIAGQAGGLAAWITSAAAGEVVAAPAEVAGSGRMHVVVSGAFTLGDVALPAFACVFTSADEPALQLTALADAAQFITLQYPAGRWRV